MCPRNKPIGVWNWVTSSHNSVMYQTVQKCLDIDSVLTIFWDNMTIVRGNIETLILPGSIWLTGAD